MKIKVNDDIELELLDRHHAPLIFDAVDKNREYLKRWLSFIEAMQTVRFAEDFIKASIQRHQEGREAGFVIFEKQQMVGRIGVYKIDPYNQMGEIGYWLTEKAQGKGVMIKACKALIDYCFADLKINRLEIKCGVENKRSQSIPEKLGFTKEGTIRQGEFLYDHFIDLNIYSLLKNEHS